MDQKTSNKLEFRCFPNGLQYPRLVKLLFNFQDKFYKIRSKQIKTMGLGI